MSRTDRLQPEPLQAAAVLDTDAANQKIAQNVLAAIDGQGYLVMTGLFDDCESDLHALQRMQEFFALPDNDPIKQAINVQDHSIKYGWMPLYGEPAYEAGTRARVESFDCGRPFHDQGYNRWPELAGFREATEALWKRFTRAGLALLEHIAMANGLPRTYLRDRCASQELSTLRLLHYPGQPVAKDPDVGISAHSDFECITLLYQSAAGLELCDRQGNWRDTETRDRDVLVLFGDMLETWTNGKIRATPHRVRMTRDPRYSMVLFFAVDDGITVAPLPGFASAEPSAYAAVTQRSHSHRRLSQAEENRDALQPGIDQRR